MVEAMWEAVWMNQVELDEKMCVRRYQEGSRRVVGESRLVVNDCGRVSLKPDGRERYFRKRSLAC
jgi:hypothetical protein